MPHSGNDNNPSGEGVGCFIAMPFAAQFNGLFTSIQKAAIQLNLRPFRVRTDERQVEDEFVADIIQGIRSARVVIAVCSPEPQTRRSNPNVMYELGWADALGKPTVILTNDPKAKPANLEARHLLIYKSRSVETEAFVQRLKLAILNRLDHVPVHTDDRDPFCPPIFLDYKFREHFLTVLSFGKNNGTDIRMLIDATISSLQKAISDAAANPNEISKVRAFDDNWVKYKEYSLDAVWDRIFNRLEDNLHRVDQSFSYLLNTAEGEQEKEVMKHVKKSFEFYGIMKDGLKEYIKLHHEMEEAPFPLLSHKDAMSDVYSLVSALSYTATKIKIQADSLVFNLIETVFQTGA